MEKGYRLVQCPEKTCGVKIRISVSEKNYGKKGAVTCPRCFVEFHTTIPVPATTGERCATDRAFADTKGFGDIFADLFGNLKKKE